MIPQNIKINNTRSISWRLCNDEYYDFMLYKGEAEGASDPSSLSVADFSCPFDVNDGRLYSKTTWEDAINNGVELEDIGFTGIDNGLITFRKDRISNEDFLNILTGSTYSIEADDKRLFLTPITGNTLNFSYPMSFENDGDNCDYLSLRGGFYQGFYKLFGFDYQTLPNGIDVEWNLNFVIRPRSDYEIGVDTVNHLHPENKGIFFYIGTRAENKFLNFYKVDSGITDTMKKENAENDGYFDSCTEGDEVDLQNHVTEKEYLQEEPEVIEEGYFKDGYTVSSSTEDCPCVEESLRREGEENPTCPSHDDEYFSDDYFAEEDKKKPLTYVHDYESSSDYTKGCNCTVKGSTQCKNDNKWVISDLYTYKYQDISKCCGGIKETSCGDSDYTQPCTTCEDYFQDAYFTGETCTDNNKAIEDEYMKEDIQFKETEIKDSFGHDFLKKGYYEIESDNKFLMFDRTPEGFNTHNWIEGTKVTLTGRQDWKNLNLFLVMNRTKTGYTVDNISEYQESNSLEYNIHKDLKNNAFALRITDDGAIGYRYAIFDCDSEDNFNVVEEYSKAGLIKDNEWNSINVKMSIINPTGIKCDPYKGKRKMKLYFYVNGYLVFISKELNEFKFKELDDVYQKQEAVPYNISLGGGTQGLLESILPDYYKESNYIFPLEKNFCGTFMGDIKSFKIYNGILNYLTTKNYLSKK